MSSIKNDQISLHSHFDKIIKGPWTSFQSPALSQKHVRNIFHTANQFLIKFHFHRTVNNPEEISVRQSDAALHHNLFSKFYFDLKMPKMVFKQGLATLVSVTKQGALFTVLSGLFLFFQMLSFDSRLFPVGLRIEKK